MNNPKTILITGASSGFGKACALRLAAGGHTVYGTSRNGGPDGSGAAPFTLLRMDVTNDDSVALAVRSIMERSGRIDAVVNNAGYGLAGAIEDTSIGEASDLIDANVLGVMRVCQAVLPHMRKQGVGHIINISSIVGSVAVPFQGIYSMTKFAVEGLSEALRMEVRPYGVKVSLIQPGDFKTGFTRNRKKAAAFTPGSVYHQRCSRALAVMERCENNGGDPGEIAGLVERILASRNPRLRYTAGTFEQRSSVFIKRLVPGAVFENLIAGYYE